MQPNNKLGMPDESPKKLFRNVRVNSDLSKAVDVDAISKEFKLSQEQTTEFKKKLKEVRRWLEEDKERLENFQESPLEIRDGFLPGIKSQVPKDVSRFIVPEVSNPCAAGPASGLYNDCVIELLRRVATWTGQNVDNRSVFISDPDVVVDEVSGSAPVEAVLLTKVALRAARRYP
jgi:hypothetical protein